MLGMMSPATSVAMSPWPLAPDRPLRPSTFQLYALSRFCLARPVRPAMCVSFGETAEMCESTTSSSPRREPCEDSAREPERCAGV